MTRQYFRRWFFWHGKTQALMFDDLYPDLDLPNVPRIAGVPRFLYRQSLEQIWLWLRSLGDRDALKVLTEELYALQYAGMAYEFWRRRKHPLASEVLQVKTAPESISAAPASPSMTALTD